MECSSFPAKVLAIPFPSERSPCSWSLSWSFPLAQPGILSLLLEWPYRKNMVAWPGFQSHPSVYLGSDLGWVNLCSQCLTKWGRGYLTPVSRCIWSTSHGLTIVASLQALVSCLFCFSNGVLHIHYCIRVFFFFVLSCFNKLWSYGRWHCLVFVWYIKSVLLISTGSSRSGVALDKGWNQGALVFKGAFFPFFVLSSSSCFSFHFYFL